tara:strand:- start:1 stop:1080 length:1080 start_codon:yes stop_codon:yes gene_type:complete
MAFSNLRQKKISILGSSGYGGMQLVRLLRNNPNYEIVNLCGQRTIGKYWNELFPFLKLRTDKIIEEINLDKISDTSDYVFLSLPNGVASTIVPNLINKNVKILDLSADYRYKSLNKWNQVYVSESTSLKRNDFKLCEQAVYGLPEIYRNEIKKANIVSCPGCFPTASLLPLLPFLKQGLIETDGIIIDAKTGTSGGGRIPKENLLLSECSESISPYGVVGHRHTSEIEQIASAISGKDIQIQFTPHLVPMVRGILSTVYCRLRDPGLTAEDCRIILDTYYRNESFIDVLDVGIYPSTKWVRNTNKAFISVQVDKRTSRLILMCVIDNLLKGQAGQAVQNLNILSGLDEIFSLPEVTFFP